MRKSIIALTVVASFVSVAASADVNQAIAFVDGFKSVQTESQFAAKSAEWQTFDSATRIQAQQYDRANGTNYTSDLANVPAFTTTGTKGSQNLTAQTSGNNQAPAMMHTATVLQQQPMIHIESVPNMVNQVTPLIPVSTQKTPQITAPVSVQKTPVAGKIPVVQQQAPQATPERQQQTPAQQLIPTVKAQSVPVAQAPTQKEPVQQLIPTVKPVEQKTPVAHTQLTPARNGADGVSGSNGKDGSNGVNGKDGITTTVVKVDTATQQRVNDNSANIAANRGEIISHSRAIAANRAGIERNSAAIEHNSQRIDRNSKDIAANRKAIKRVGAMAQAASNLHYNVNHNGYAVSVGEYQGNTAIAGGVQFQTGAHTAVTLQASYDGEAVGASVGFHGDF